MAVSITPKGNRLFSGKLSAYEEQLFYQRINAGPKTIAKASVRQTKKLKEERGGSIAPARFCRFLMRLLDHIYFVLRYQLRGRMVAPVRFVARASRGSPFIYVNICPKRIRNGWQKFVVSISLEPENIEASLFRLPLKIVVSIPDVYLNICFSFDFAGYGATILLSNPDQRLASVGF